MRFTEFSTDLSDRYTCTSPLSRQNTFSYENFSRHTILLVIIISPEEFSFTKVYLVNTKMFAQVESKENASGKMFNTFHVTIPFLFKRFSRPLE